MSSESGILPLFCRSSALSIEADLDLYGVGSSEGVEGVSASLDLYAGTGTQSPSGYLPLWAFGQTPGVLSGVLPLWVAGRRYSTEGYLPLYQNTPGATGYLPLIAYGLGETQGALPYSGGFDMWVGRSEGGYLPLYALGEGTFVSGIVEMLAIGSYVESGVLELYASGTGFEEKTLKLYGRGF